MSRMDATGQKRRVSGRGRMGAAWLAVGLLGLFGAALVVNGCYDHSSGNPVDKHHYKHFISVAKDHAHLSIQTYISRSQWEVGFRSEDLYDGNRDGKLTTPGLDRVIVTDYVDVEDPPESAVRRKAEIRDYDGLFKEILGALNRGEKKFLLQNREYEFRILSENLASTSGPALG